MKKIFFVLITAVFVFANGVKIGEKAPEISAKNADGNQVKLSEFEGKIVVIRFWEKGCSHCVQEMPKLQALSQEYKNDLAIIAVNSHNSLEDIKAFSKEYGITFTLLKDDLDITKKRYGVAIVPTTFIINKNGAVVEKIFGMSSWEKSREKILEAL